MRVLSLSALFPPNTIGGAEISAASLARWLQAHGHEVGVLTTARSAQDVLDGELVDGLRTWRIDPPRPYRIADHQEASGWKKPVWHLQDHLDPRNGALVGRVLDAFRPDFVNIHLMAGLGYNALAEVSRRGIPALYALPDLGLVCLRASMFRGGRECEGRCVDCAVSARMKRGWIAGFDRIGFYSPSAANARTLARWFPLADYPNDVLLNPNAYPEPTEPPTSADHVRFLYVGRVHETKGVDVLVEAAAGLAEGRRFSLEVVGGGPQEAPLKARYGRHPWLTFRGRVPQVEVSNAMARSDVLCIPSIWAENSPGVVIQALGRGLAVIGSDKGGIPELVEPERNGLLVAPGDVQAWRGALARAVDEPDTLARWRRGAAEDKARFTPERLGAALLAFIEDIRAGDRTRSHVGRRAPSRIGT